MPIAENNKKVILIIMDGWGQASAGKANAISRARTPFVGSLEARYPHSLLQTSGEHVGLPDGQMGNSEVGHLNIGAGRVVYQELVLINKAIREKTFRQNNTLLQAMAYARDHHKPLHIMGLVSDGGVHSHLDHAAALCEMAAAAGVKDIFIHAFTDGRDTDPRSGLDYLKKLQDMVKPYGALIASAIGRYYAMDRDQRWERVKLAYDLLVRGEGVPTTDVIEAVQSSYAHDVTDEFIKPIVCTGADHQPLALIREGDAVICFNFRTDRCREITRVLTQDDMPDLGMKTLNLHYVTMTNYDDRFRGIHVVFPKQNLSMTIGEVLEKAGKTQVRIAETEKYPHVTFFFSGGREAEFTGETRIMIPSPKVATYDMKPSMSAFEVTDAIVKEIEAHAPDFICLNYANADMVGHTGDFKAAVEAVETVDTCVKRVVETGLSRGYSLLITADHGNADKMINEDGSPNTAHTTNPVPLYLVTPDKKGRLKNGCLADLAPTMLHLMGISIPAEMNGTILTEKTEGETDPLYRADFP